jgi:hypothetical protein
VASSPAKRGRIEEGAWEVAAASPDLVTTSPPLGTASGEARRHPETPSLDPGIYDGVSGFHRDFGSSRDGVRTIRDDILRTHRSIQGSAATSPELGATSA